MGSNDSPVKKIYIDSKFRRHDSVSTSNFKTELPYTVKINDNTIFYVDDVCIPHSWHTVETGVNDKLYLRLISSSINTDYVLTLTPQSYNGVQLATEIAVQITNLFISYTPTCAYNSQTQRISLSVAVSVWAGGSVSSSYDVNSLDSVNELLTYTSNISTAGTPSIPVQLYLNLQPIRNVYMRSPNISSFNTIGCNGESSISKKYQ